MTKTVDELKQATFTHTIDGQAVAGSAFDDVIDPSTGAPFQRSPVASAEDIDRAVQAARRAQPAWAALSWDERAAYLDRLATALEAEADWLGAINTMEVGGHFPGSRAGIGMTATRLRMLGAVRAPDKVLVDDAGRRVVEHWVPLGVVGAIAPWNAPIILGMTKVVNALISGNTVVLKPSELTPLGTLEIGRISRDILPPGVFNVLGGGRATGAAMVAHKGFDKISFTGSTATGLAIARESAGYLRPLTLELGGNDAAILLPDGSIPDLVTWTVNVGLANCGQFCAGIKRVYVPTDRYDEFCAALVAAAEQVRIGQGFEPGVQMGPIQNKAQFDKVCAIVDDARAAGGKILTGGAPLPGDGYFYPPTVVAGLKDGVRLVDEEQFGPVVPVIAYDDLDAVIDLVNGGPYGLTGSVWTADLDRGAEVVSRLHVGTGWVNQHGAFDAMIAMPLIKFSGTGVDNADYGVKGTMRLQVISTKKPAA